MQFLFAFAKPDKLISTFCIIVICHVFTTKEWASHTLSPPLLSYFHHTITILSSRELNHFQMHCYLRSTSVTVMNVLHFDTMLS